MSLVCTKEMCRYAFDVLLGPHGLKINTTRPSFRTNLSAPCFVTWTKKGRRDEWDLRGCIGTFSSGNLETNIGKYARIAAFQDTRFGAIRRNEVESLRVEISLLTNFENGRDCWDWTVGTHGISIKIGGRSATYLPDVAPEQGWDQKTTLNHLLRKARWSGRIDESVYSQIKLERYQSSVEYLTYQEYVGEA